MSGASTSEAAASGYAMYYPPASLPQASISGADADVDVDIEAIKETAERRFASKAARDEAKRRQEINFPHGPVCIFFVGDQHIGNEGTDVARIFAEQELMLDTPGAYVWQTGDGVDDFVIGGLIKENWNPSLPIYEQWKLFEHYMQSFGDRLVAYNSGNHEQFARKVVGVDLAREICPKGILYDADEIAATITVAGTPFRAISRHKYLRSSQFSQTHGQEHWARFSDSSHDIYVGAHRHTGAVAREFVLGEERKLAIQTGTYKMVDSYAREKGFGRHDCSTACALLLHDDGSFFATSSLKAARNYMKAVYAKAVHECR